MTDETVRPARHEFFARHVGVDEGFAITAGFARDPADESTLDALLLQRGPGIHGICVEIPIQRHVVYGGITGAVLQRDRLTICFDATAAGELAGFREIVIRFELPGEAFAGIRKALRTIFAGCSCYGEELVSPA